MPGLLLDPAQLATLLDAAGLVPSVGSPLHGAPVTDPLPVGHPGRRALVEQSALVAREGGDRPNAAVVSALRACTEPDEVLWFGPAAPDASVTVCRRGRLFVDCSQRSDDRISLVFPLDRSQLVLLATAALSGERPEPASTGFALRGPVSDALLLRAIADLNARQGNGVLPDRPAVLDALRGVLDDPRKIVDANAYGVRADPHHVLDEPARFDEAIDRLTAAGHLVPGELQISPVSAAVLDAPVVASLGVGRRVIEREADGSRRLCERNLRIERRRERLVTMQVVAVAGDPYIEMVERTRAEIRSLVGVFLLGDVWDRIATVPAPPTSR